MKNDDFFIIINELLTKIIAFTIKSTKLCLGLMFKMFSMKNNVKMYRFKFVLMQQGENTIKRRPF